MITPNWPDPRQTVAQEKAAARGHRAWLRKYDRRKPAWLAFAALSLILVGVGIVALLEMAMR